MRHSYPNVALLSLWVLVTFASTYLCASGFSILLQIKTKARNRLDVQDDMRFSLNFDANKTKNFKTGNADAT